MRKRMATIVISVLLVLVFAFTGQAAELTVDGLRMNVPESWTETEREDGEDGSIKITYSCGNGYMQAWTAPYDESLSDMSYILLDAAIYGIKSTDGYTEVDSSSLAIAGKDAHYTMFSCNGTAGMLVSVDTGVSIANFLYMCPGGGESEFDEFADLLDNASFSDSQKNADENEYTKYTSGVYKVGTDIPAGEYILFNDGFSGYFCVSSDSNQDDIIFNDNFNYNSIITINDGEYLDLTRCYAIPFSEDPDVDLDDAGMFKVGTHIPAGEYKIESTDGTGYYCIYTNSRQEDIVSNDNFDGQNYVTVTDGQYLELSRCKFSETPSKPVKTYTDAETVIKVQEALNKDGYDCGTPDGIAGSGTKSAIEKYQSDKGLAVTGTITDDLLKELGI